MSVFATYYKFLFMDAIARHPVLLLLLPYMGGLVLGVSGFIGFIVLAVLMTRVRSDQDGVGPMKGLLLVLMSAVGVLAGRATLPIVPRGPSPGEGLVVLEGRIRDGPWPVRVFGIQGRLLYLRDRNGLDYRVTVEGRREGEPVTGDRIRVRGRLRRQGAALFVRTSADLIDPISTDMGGHMEKAVFLFRKKLHEGLNTTLDRGHAGLAATMLLGIPGQIDSRTRERFQRTGTAHLLAISGLHMGLITMLSAWCLARLGFRDRQRIRLLVPMLGLFCLLTGCRIPVLRAYLVCVFYLVSMETHRRIDSMDPLFNACLVLLILDPNALAELSFQLSFAGYFAILAFLKVAESKRSVSRDMGSSVHGGTLLSLIDRPYPLMRTRRLLASLTRKALLLLKISLASWLGTLPLTLFYFQVFVPWAPVINVLVFPLFMLSLTATAIHTLALAFDLGGSVITQWPADAAMSLMCDALDYLGAIRPGALDTPPISPVVVILCYGMSAMGLVAWFARGRRAREITAEDRDRVSSRSI